MRLPAMIVIIVLYNVPMIESVKHYLHSYVKGFYSNNYKEYKKVLSFFKLQGGCEVTTTEYLHLLSLYLIFTIIYLMLCYEL